jgi:hypothetical protein
MEDVMRNVRWILVALAALVPELGAAADQSFLAPTSWAGNVMTYGSGWHLRTPRMLADVNGDGRQDIVGFNDQGVWLATSTGTRFSPPLLLAEFRSDQGWRWDRHLRTTGRVNNDGRADVVVFGDDDV